MKYPEVSISMSDKPNIITVPDLKSFFFQSLDELNNRSLCPIPQSAIYYSSIVLDRLALSDSYFEEDEGRLREKILGTKLLEAASLSRDEQRRVYQEVGDSALMICGYFAESVTRKKILDTNYYQQLGHTAYSRLNSLVPKHLDIPSFFSVLASSFIPLTTLIAMLASRDRFDNDRHLLFKKVMQEEVSSQELLTGGILPPSKKVS
jgi:hypothetical protein